MCVFIPPIILRVDLLVLQKMHDIFVQHGENFLAPSILMRLLYLHHLKSVTHSSCSSFVGRVWSCIMRDTFPQSYPKYTTHVRIFRFSCAILLSTWTINNAWDKKFYCHRTISLQHFAVCGTCSPPPSKSCSCHSLASH